MIQKFIQKDWRSYNFQLETVFYSTPSRLQIFSIS